RKAPVVPLYSSTWSLKKLLTKRLPLGPNTRSMGKNKPPLLVGTKAVRKAPAVPSYSSTWLVEKPLGRNNWKRLTKRLPLGPNTRPVGAFKPPLHDATKAVRKAPVVPLYSRTWSLQKLLTKRLPLGPNTRPRGAIRPPLPAGTKAAIKAPVVPLYASTW